jgi:hypothetical protein
VSCKYPVSRKQTASLEGRRPFHILLELYHGLAKGTLPRGSVTCAGRVRAWLDPLHRLNAPITVWNFVDSNVPLDLFRCSASTILIKAEQSTSHHLLDDLICGRLRCKGGKSDLPSIDFRQGLTDLP